MVVDFCAVLDWGLGAVFGAEVLGVAGCVDFVVVMGFVEGLGFGFSFGGLGGGLSVSCVDNGTLRATLSVKYRNLWVE